MSIICTNCGKELSDNAMFCTECGASVETAGAGTDTIVNDQASTVADQTPIQATEPSPSVNVDMTVQDRRTAPLKLFTYFGLTLLFAIPGVGLVSSLVFGIASKNINCKRFAWSSFIWNCIITVLLTVAAVILVVVIGAFVSEMNSQGSFDAIKEGLKTLLDSFKNIGSIGNMPS